MNSAAQTLVLRIEARELYISERKLRMKFRGTRHTFIFLAIVVLARASRDKMARRECDTIPFVSFSEVSHDIVRLPLSSVADHYQDTAKSEHNKARNLCNTWTRRLVPDDEGKAMYDIVEGSSAENLDFLRGLFEKQAGAANEHAKYRFGGINKIVIEDEEQLDQMIAKERRPWKATYDSMAEAIAEARNEFPIADELIFAGYVGRRFAEQMQDCAQGWEIKKVRLLLHDVESELGKLCKFPPDENTLVQKAADAAVAREDFNHRLKVYLPIRELAIRYHVGIPTLRGMVVNGQLGFGALYCSKRGPVADASSRESQLLRLDDECETSQEILSGFKNWYEMAWEVARPWPFEAE